MTPSLARPGAGARLLRRQNRDPVFVGIFEESVAGWPPRDEVERQLVITLAQGQRGMTTWLPDRVARSAPALVDTPSGSGRIGVGARPGEEGTGGGAGRGDGGAVHQHRPANATDVAGPAAARADGVRCVPGRLDASVDVTGERNIASQIAFGVSDRSAQRPSTCLRMSM